MTVWLRRGPGPDGDIRPVVAQQAPYQHALRVAAGDSKLLKHGLRALLTHRVSEAFFQHVPILATPKLGLIRPIPPIAFYQNLLFSVARGRTMEASLASLGAPVKTSSDHLEEALWMAQPYKR